MIAVFVFIISVAIIFSISFLWCFSFKVKEQQVLNELQIISLQDRITTLQNQLDSKEIEDNEFKEDFNYFCNDLGIFD